MPRKHLSVYRSLRACKNHCAKKGGQWLGVFRWPLSQDEVAKHSSLRAPAGHEFVEVHLKNRIFCFSIPLSAPPRKSLGYKDVRIVDYATEAVP